MPTREQQGASSSSGRNESQNPIAQASGDQLQSALKEDEDIRNLLSPGFELNPNLLRPFRVARLTLQTRKLWLVGVATDRHARYF